MNFQSYIKSLITYFSEKNDKTTANKKGNNRNDTISSNWFGLFPLSFKLFFHK